MISPLSPIEGQLRRRERNMRNIEIINVEIIAGDQETWCWVYDRQTREVVRCLVSVRGSSNSEHTPTTKEEILKELGEGI